MFLSLRRCSADAPHATHRWTLRYRGQDGEAVYRCPGWVDLPGEAREAGPSKANLVWLTVHDAEAMMGHGGSSHLYVRDWAGDFLPRPGEHINVLHSAEDDEWSVSTEVKSVSYDADGSAHVHLVDYQIDPNEQMQKHMSGQYRRAWWTDVDGDLKGRLAESGWLTYEQWRGQ